MSAECSLIILGNSGVGKSFLANVLLGEDRFVHKPSPRAVTTATEHYNARFYGRKFAVFNVPDLIDQDLFRIDGNTAEIDKAFVAQPYSLILFVFEPRNGRINDEDIIAFNTINEMYQFKVESLVLVINSLPKQLPPMFKGKVITFLNDNLNIAFENMYFREQICFLEQIDLNDSAEREALREKLIETIVTLTPRVHKKQQNNHMCTMFHPSSQHQNFVMLDRDTPCGIVLSKHLQEIKEKTLEAIATAAACATKTIRAIFDTKADNKQFAADGTYKKSYCNGRPCAKCILCRDWYYTGDWASWNWIRNCKHWEKSDWQRYRNDHVTERFKRRDGATCNSSSHHVGSDDLDACLCEDNIQSGF